MANSHGPHATVSTTTQSVVPDNLLRARSAASPRSQGMPRRRMGNEFVYSMLAQQNITTLNEAGAKTIVGVRAEGETQLLPGERLVGVS